MNVLSYLEKAWIAAAIAAIGVALYNAITLRVFDNRVYFPIFCAVFCMLLWYNVRGQRRFKEKIDAEEKQRQNQQPKQ